MPELFIIAGPNGAGKSTNAEDLLQRISSEKVESFDFDKEKWDFYKNDPLDFDYEHKEEAAHNRATEKFNLAAAAALKEKKTFCFETNFFNNDVMTWPDEFKAAGFKITLLFFAIDSVEKSIERVKERVINKGHRVPEYQIQERFQGSKENANQHYQKFDRFLLVDTNNKKPIVLAEFLDQKLEFYTNKDLLTPSIKDLFLPIFKEAEAQIKKSVKKTPPSKDQGLSM